MQTLSNCDRLDEWQAVADALRAQGLADRADRLQNAVDVLRVHFDCEPTTEAVADEAVRS